MTWHEDVSPVYEQAHLIVPENPSIEEQRTLIEEGLIRGEQNSNESRWQTLLERAGNRPIWMLNMLEFRATAQYPEDAGDAAPSTGTTLRLVFTACRRRGAQSSAVGVLG